MCYRCPSSLVVAVISLLLEALNGRRWAQEGPLLWQQRYFALFTLPPPKTGKPWMKIRSGDWWKTVALLEFSDLERKQKSRLTGPIFPEVVRAGGGILWLQLKLQSDLPVPLSFVSQNVLYRLGGCAERCLVSNRRRKSTVRTFLHTLCYGCVEEARGRSDPGAKWRGSVWNCQEIHGRSCLFVFWALYSDWVVFLFWLGF